MAGNLQLLSIDLHGQVSTIRRKRGNGLDLRELQDGQGVMQEVRRVTEIQWSNRWQAFRIRIKPRQPERQEYYLTRANLASVGADTDPACRRIASTGAGDVLCCDYEDAVSIELVYLDAVKANGDDHIW